MNEETRFYVYEWFNVETNEVFYVGKGTGRRKNSISTRTRYFKFYYNKHKCDVRIVCDNLTKENALELEKQLIAQYKAMGQAQVNLTDGGEDAPVLSGSANGMYGKTHTAEVRERLRLINSDGRHKGENNEQYGISPSQRMDDETYQQWKKKHEISLKGERNPQFGVSPKERMDEETYATWAEKQRARKLKAGNPNSKKIAMYDQNKNLVAYFDYIGACIEFLIENNITRSKRDDAIRTGIWKSIKKSVLYYGYYFYYANE